MSSTISILYEDDALVAINKPAGIVVNNAENVTVETVQDWASAYLHISTGESPFASRAGIVHRLDKETSGILLIAKNEISFAELQKQFFERTTKKYYTALVHGQVSPKEGIIKAPVGRLPWDRKKFGVLPEGREAETGYTVETYYINTTEKYSLLRVEPLTGRTHQIRIHFKHLGHSLVADPLYAGKHLYEQDLLFCPRLFLHATKIEFDHPVGKRKITIEAPLPEDLAGVIIKLERK
jgi:23S rRNA pseudouridine1911/1915/1917 synthase